MKNNDEHWYDPIWKFGIIVMFIYETLEFNPADLHFFGLLG